ncbi:MAG: NUDIX hydrolase [Alphaproteobacteria bacterium]|nr:NUDIX hydrolase [Alphaproteobacteria bacterium]
MDARFMPGIYVFPGGRVDRSDYAEAEAFSIRQDVLAKLKRHCPPRRAHALIWAAIRETWEETGLLIGQPGDIDEANRSPLHTAYAQQGLSPWTEGLDYIARAITPARNPIRFNTRFFLVNGSHAPGKLKHSSELEDIGWRRVSEAISDLDLMNVTRFALTEAMTLWSEGLPTNPERPVARLTTRLQTKLITLE